MRLIEALEAAPRGPYCGAIGALWPDGSASFNVAIRTAIVRAAPGQPPGPLHNATFSYSVGAGIVADSDPAAEWQETLDKAAMLTAATGAVILP
jgi:para-aminobenzoate synthetase/4-amino-4-deoxychorismate lyase